MNKENNIKIRWIAGFWQRLGALLIDGLILGGIGYGLGTSLGRFFVELGSLGIFIGFFVALIYFSVLNSTVANGQTVGKYLFGIRVVNIENKPISLIKSLTRSCVLCIPVFMNGASLPSELNDTLLVNLLSLIFFGGLFSLGYLYIFNRRTRQSLHDLAFKTYVVNILAENQKISNVWKPHLIVVGLFSIVTLLLPTIFHNTVPQKYFDDLSKTQESLLELPVVNKVQLNIGSSWVKTTKGESSETSYVSAKVFLNENLVSNADLARLVAAQIVNDYDLALEKDIIKVNLVYGYDIGIFSQWENHAYHAEPIELAVNMISANANKSL